VVRNYHISTLVYAFDESDQVLLVERVRPPNAGLWSPFGGKLEMHTGESPYHCAARETKEEIGLEFLPGLFHLTGLVSEHAYQGEAHWLMFLFELRTRLTVLPPVHAEGRFNFFPRASLDSLPMPATDREFIWPLFWQHRGGFFSAHCATRSDGSSQWQLEESVPNRP
jgi:8-oxo-dGTP diphosphatase